MQMTETKRWRFKGPEMEGPIARWYARVRGSQSQLEAYRKQASQLTAGLPQGARVLEVAPGPGYLAIEIARLGGFQVTGLDISTFTTTATLEMLRRRAYSAAQFERLADQSPFQTCAVNTEGIGLEVRLNKEERAAVA